MIMGCALGGGRGDGRGGGEGPVSEGILSPLNNVPPDTRMLSTRAVFIGE